MSALADDPVWEELPEGTATIEDGDEVVGIWIDPNADVDLQELDKVLDKAGMPPVGSPE